MNRRAFILGSCCILAACAGPVRTRYGALPSSHESARLPSAVALTASAAGDGSRSAVAQALREQGVGVDEASPYEMHIGLSARPDPVGLFDAQGQSLAPPRKQRLLQSCHNMGYRLSLAVADRRSGAVIARGWAEESHCAASLDAVLPVLARQSVAMLARPESRTGSALRWTRD